jgi:uncharacterized damage-inducible protein DinB
MNEEIHTIAVTLQNTLSGTPWYGRPMYEMLAEIDPAIAYKKPADHAHSLADLLYHMLTWADFTLKRVEKEKIADMKAFDDMDWRALNPATDTWQKGVDQLKETHTRLLQLLQTKDDMFLDEKVDYREYNFRYLLHGLHQHNIYHLGQIAYVKKLLTSGW